MYADERPPSLLEKRRIEPSVIALGALFAVGAHLLIPTLLLASQWLLVLLGLAIPVEERERPKLETDVIAAEFVKLGKPFDPQKLPNRKVPPVVKRRPDGVVVSRDAQEKPKDEDKKERPKEAQDSLLDNLVDRTKDFAEDVETEQEGDPNGIAEGTATVAKAGDLYRGKLKIFFQRNWSVPNVVQNPDKLMVKVAVKVSTEGLIEEAGVSQSSGDPYFDQSAMDAVTTLIQSKATIPEPPPELITDVYGQTIEVRFDGRDMR